jgi:hypothetical protein
MDFNDKDKNLIDFEKKLSAHEASDAYERELRDAFIYAAGEFDGYKRGFRNAAKMKPPEVMQHLGTIKKADNGDAMAFASLVCDLSRLQKAAMAAAATYDGLD